MKLTLKQGVVMLLLSLLLQNLLVAEDASVEFTNAKSATTTDGKEIKYYLPKDDVTLEISNPDGAVIHREGDADSIKFKGELHNGTNNGKAQKTGITTVFIDGDENDDIAESSENVSDTAVVPGVKFFLTSKRNWVSARVAYAAHGVPDDLFTYDWSVGGSITSVKLEKMERYRYVTVMQPTLKDDLGGELKVEYGPVNDLFKYIEITTPYYVRIKPNRPPVNYIKYSINKETDKEIMNTVLSYFIYDQYSKRMSKSFPAGLHLKVKESCDIYSPFIRMKKALEEADMNREWVDSGDIFTDSIHIGDVPKDVFLNYTDDYFADMIKNGMIAFKVSNHSWYVSIEEKYVKKVTENTLTGTFTSVKRKYVDGERKVVSFILKVLYTYKLL